MTNLQTSHVLVVDDDHDNAHSLAELLELEGHRVQIAYSGADAVAVSKSTSFDLTFMDVMMPGMNGLESFVEIRRTQPKARVYMMTGYSVEDLLRQAVKQGALGVLEKPFDAEAVLRLTQSVGPGGLVVSTPGLTSFDTGQAIRSAIEEHGGTCRHVKSMSELGQPHIDEVLVLDTKSSLIDAVGNYQQALRGGQTAPTVIVPSSDRFQSHAFAGIVGVEQTGVLRKPFDPDEVLALVQKPAA
jgi:two-component system, NtrC family, response regulator HydG